VRDIVVIIPENMEKTLDVVHEKFFEKFGYANYKRSLECYKEISTGDSGENAKDKKADGNADNKGYAYKFSDKSEDSIPN
jgi:hypothetical protein